MNMNWEQGGNINEYLKGTLFRIVLSKVPTAIPFGTEILNIFIIFIHTLHRALH